MSSKEYAALLKRPEWKLKREEILSRDKHNHKLITLNPYRTELIICDGYVELPFELTDEEVELTKTVKDARTIKTSTGALLVVFNLKTVGTIAHEAFHITEYLMELKDIPYNDDTSEVWAYMIGYIVDEINGFLK